jgi:predicted aldo/keto reductase-like oxidoreductase
MKYRKFGKLDWEVSVLGFGAMRMPTTSADPADIDEPEAIKMIRYAIDNGVNYLDTAYPYHMGKSEGLVTRALKDGYRERMKLATKMPCRMVERAEDFDRFFGEQRERLENGKIDFYLLHGLNTGNWPKVRDFGIIQWAEDKMAKGYFDYLGFSFHDTFEVFKEIIDYYDNWVLSQIQYNFMDVDFQAGRRGVEYAASKGLAIVVMEPLRGGRLTKQPPEAVSRVWDSAAQKRSLAEWGLRWVWNQPEISVVLSGMSTMEQVVENVDIASRSAAGILTSDDFALYEKVRAAYHGLVPVPCTGCEYCLPCPNGVAIPEIFTIYNDAIMYNDLEGGRMRYQGPMTPLPEEQADNCIECGECLEKCPQGIDIITWLQKAHEVLAAES